MHNIHYEKHNPIASALLRECWAHTTLYYLLNTPARKRNLGFNNRTAADDDVDDGARTVSSNKYVNRSFSTHSRSFTCTSINEHATRTFRGGLFVLSINVGTRIHVSIVQESRSQIADHSLHKPPTNWTVIYVSAR